MLGNEFGLIVSPHFSPLACTLAWGIGRNCGTFTSKSTSNCHLQFSLAILLLTHLQIIKRRCCPANCQQFKSVNYDANL